MAYLMTAPLLTFIFINRVLLMLFWLSRSCPRLFLRCVADLGLRFLLLISRWSILPVDDAPPAYIRTVYDDTYRARWYIEPSIMSTANSPNLLGHLEHHSTQTDFAICVVNGSGVFVSKVSSLTRSSSELA